MNKIIAPVAAALVACACAPLAHADAPAVGDACYKWHATATDASGATLFCTHLPDWGHIMFWEYSVQDSAWVVTR